MRRQLAPAARFVLHEQNGTMYLKIPSLCQHLRSCALVPSPHVCIFNTVSAQSGASKESPVRAANLAEPHIAPSILVQSWCARRGALLLLCKATIRCLI